MSNNIKFKFLKAYNSFPPNNFIKFIYKYFSLNTKKEDSWLKNTIIIFLLILFLCGFVSVAFHLKNNFNLIITYIFCVLLASLILSITTAVIMNDYRIDKIRKLLGGISKEEYYNLVTYYLGDEFI